MQLSVNGKSAYLGTLGRDLDAAKPTVVFVHGAALDHTVWTLFARYFARHGYNTIAVDLPGHGRSEGPPLDRVEALSDWLGAALDTAGLGETILIGHSLGSLVCLHHAASTERVSALGLVGIGLPMAVTDVLMNAAKENRHDALDMLTIWGHSPKAQLGGFSSPGIWMTGSQLKLNERTAPGVLYADLTACNEYELGLSDAGKVTCPTSLVLGQHDMMTPVRATRELGATVAQVNITVIKGCGHALMAEQPNQVLDALIALARDVAAPAAA